MISLGTASLVHFSSNTEGGKKAHPAEYSQKNEQFFPKACYHWQRKLAPFRPHASLPASNCRNFYVSKCFPFFRCLTARRCAGRIPLIASHWTWRFWGSLIVPVRDHGSFSGAQVSFRLG